MTESSYRLHGEAGGWEVVIGLDVHARGPSKAGLSTVKRVGFKARPEAWW